MFVDHMHELVCVYFVSIINSAALLRLHSDLTVNNATQKAQSENKIYRPMLTMMMTTTTEMTTKIIQKCDS